MSMHSICNHATFRKSRTLSGRDLSARRNRAGQRQSVLIELNRPDQAEDPSSVTDKTNDKIEEMLGASGGNLAYAGYPYDPYTLEAPKH